MAADNGNPSQPDLDRRARLRIFIQRRRRFWRSVALFILMTTAIVLLALANRDTQKWRAVCKQAEMVAEALQDAAEEHNSLPLRLPDITTPYGAIHGKYYFNMYYASQAKWVKPVGVCCYKTPVRFYVRGDGRPVVLYDGEEFRAEWRTEDEFGAEAEALGLGALLDP